MTSPLLLKRNLPTPVIDRIGKELDCEANNLRASNCPEAERYIHKSNRKGCVLNG